MNRRSMLGLLGLAPTLGAAVAKQAIGASGELAVSTSGMTLTTGGYTPDVVPSKMDFAEKSMWQLQMFNDAQDSLKKLTHDKDTWIAEAIATELQHHMKYNPRIDYDILGMKSISDVAKIRMQARRNAERQYENDKQHLAQRIKSYLDGKEIW